MTREFFNDKGRCFARLDDMGVLHKNEHEKDRLRITGGKAYAIDETLFRAALDSGGKILEICEKTLKNGKRVFRIPLSDIPRFGRRVNIRGIQRWTVPLDHCKLIKGPDEPWRLEAMKLQSVKQSEEKQACLFGA